MACGRSAERKFWSSPELVEGLLVGFLEPRSVVNLAQVHTLALETLQKPIVWKKVTDKAVDPRKDGWEKEDGTWKTEDGRGEAEFFNFHQDKMDDLAYILWIWSILTRSKCIWLRSSARGSLLKLIKMTVRGTMVRSEVCNSWCFCLES